MQRMRSLITHSFSGKELHAGDEFYANPQEERVLQAIGRAYAIDEEIDDPKPPKNTRSYRRRNMRARPSNNEYETK